MDMTDAELNLRTLNSARKKELEMAKLDSSHFLYDCSQCGDDNYFKPKDQIRCARCGSRVLFKKRTKRMVQFEAR